MSEENKMSVGGGAGGGSFQQVFHKEEKTENIRTHAALWMQSVANAELVFYYHYYFTWQTLLSMTLVLFICHILPFL